MLNVESAKLEHKHRKIIKHSEGTKGKKMVTSTEIDLSCASGDVLKCTEKLDTNYNHFPRATILELIMSNGCEGHWNIIYVFFCCCATKEQPCMGHHQIQNGGVRLILRPKSHSCLLVYINLIVARMGPF